MARGNEGALIHELRNQGTSQWDPLSYPERLLLEIESNIRIRDVQTNIANVMCSPPKDANSVVQLNMGEGKSSIIAPMVAMSLADTSCLVRVIVAKPQAKQMLDMMVSKMGGLVGRRVYQLPFSRSLNLGTKEIDFIKHLCQECIKNGGVLLVQPEQFLSLQLLSIVSTLSTEKGDITGKLLEIHRDFNIESRDIIDEADEILDPKHEIIYTVGEQRPIDFAPDRWVIIQQILDLVRRFSDEVRSEHQKGIEIETPGREQEGYPRIRILEEAAWETLSRLICEHICKNNILPGFPSGRQPSEICEALFRYIHHVDVSEANIQLVQGSIFWTYPTANVLFLLRGLFANQVLCFCLSQKRWRVDYGLDASRSPSTQLAVPYMAKDCPSSKSEFSNPDVVIVLTCLSYYYGGLSDDDLSYSVALLLKSDQANLEYQTWASSSTFPLAYRELEGINWEDDTCKKELFYHLRDSKATVDFFLKNVVFSKHMKEFPQKLSASGWDVARQKKLPTTGFSGTNDSREILPLDMTQLDIPELQHTNALVLEKLLQPENDVCLMSGLSYRGMFSGRDLIKAITANGQEIRVILDVGAQVLDLTNEEMAKVWLEENQKKDIKAVVFCDQQDHIVVIDRHGIIELLQTSVYATKLDRCLVFLDQAHTRGIDLRLPGSYRAAVTLGANLTKDHMVQGKPNPPLHITERELIMSI